MTDPSLIYDEIQRQVVFVFNKLAEQQGSEGRVGEDISAAVEGLGALNKTIQDEYDKLKELSEWTHFTIAFYGETNAGKSTLIEALRLLLKEPSKLKSQSQFKEAQRRSGLTQEAFDKVRHSIMSSEDKIESVKKELGKLDQKYSGAIKKVELEILRLSELIQEIKTGLSWWKKIATIFYKTPESLQLKDEKNKLAKLLKEENSEKKTIDLQLEAVFTQKKNAEKEQRRLDAKAEKLKEFADGQIIGNGRSDFTRHNTAFKFNAGGQEFTLIDVPGIEGAEDLVREPIAQAVRKAHAVFYVTRAPRPPQTHDGDAGSRKGTLEKIKEHLGAQTEVWSIYNHPVNNPRQLKKPLLDENDVAGLVAMDEKLKKALPDQYCKSLIVSAWPAYLSLTDCTVPGSKETVEQKKLMTRFDSRDEILTLSGLSEFVDTLKSDIVGDYRSKIRRSNLNKAYKVLEASLVELKKAHNVFEDGEKKVRSEVRHAKSQIDVLLEQFSGRLGAVRSKVIRNFESQVQEQLYERIDDDISNDEFKRLLKESVEEASANLEFGLRDAIKKEAEDVGVNINKVVQRSNHHLRNIIAMQNEGIAMDKFDMTVDVDNGLQLTSLVASGVGLVTGVFLLASNPVGWTVAVVGGVLAVVGSLIGLAKSGIMLFNSNYKKSQQRKETDKVLIKAKASIGKEIGEVVEAVSQEMTKQMKVVYKELQAPVNQYTAITSTMKRAESELSSIAQRVKN